MWCFVVRTGSPWCILGFMALTKTRNKAVRRSVALSGELNRKIQKMAKHLNSSANRVIEDLIEKGIEAKEAEKRHFFELAERLRATDDQTELSAIKSELARMTFGE
jgi:predicted DNA-binding protein